MKKLADKIRRVGLIGNLEKADSAVFIRKAARLIERAGRRVFYDAQTARLAEIQRDVRPDTKSLAAAVDLLLIFGGDGTILRTAREIAGVSTPMLGVNIGGLGFLTGVPSDKLGAALKLLWRGDFAYESRALIQASGRCHGRTIHETALNDIVVGRAQFRGPSRLTSAWMASPSPVTAATDSSSVHRPVQRPIHWRRAVQSFYQPPMCCA